MAVARHAARYLYLARELNGGERLGISLTNDEMNDLRSFLETLTDYKFISNPIF